MKIKIKQQDEDDDGKQKGTPSTQAIPVEALLARARRDQGGRVDGQDAATGDAYDVQNEMELHDLPDTIFDRIGTSTPSCPGQPSGHTSGAAVGSVGTGGGAVGDSDLAGDPLKSFRPWQARAPWRR